MALTVLRDDRIIEGRDAASVWAQVADLARIEEWFPVYSVQTLAGDVPSVGNVFFVSNRRSNDTDAAVRLEIVEWTAGSTFTIAVDRLPGMQDGRFKVSVSGEPPDDTAHVFLEFTGSTTGIQGRVVAFEISRRFGQALRALDG